MALGLTRKWKEIRDTRERQREEERERRQTALNAELVNAIPRKEHGEPAADEPGLIAKLADALKRGANVDSVDHFCWSALDRCTIWGYTQAAMFLVSAGAKLSDKCVQQAAAFGDAPLLQMFFEHGATGKETNMGADLMSSAVSSNGREDEITRKKACVELLLEKGLVFDERKHAPVVFTHSPWLAHYFPGLAEAKALQEAAAAGDVATAKDLLARGVKADSAATEYRADSALYLAAAKGDLAMIELLAEAGADPNLISPVGELTPLEAALENKHMQAFRKLWELGGSVDVHSPQSILSTARRNGGEWEALVKQCAHDETIIVKKKTTILKPLSFKQPPAVWGV